ncbi:hypothetical protein [Streptomyces sp. NPDC048106]|uniref:hypothetical protein n=1 Tax=Streptomyces sp. NPDC048106 TaxID=3155750 RepID=UPI003455F57B
MGRITRPLVDRSGRRETFTLPERQREVADVQQHAAEEAQRDGRVPMILGLGLGLVVGFTTREAVLTIFQHTWTYCLYMDWPPTADLVDSPRFSLLPWLGYGMLYSACLPAGFWAGRRLLRSHVRSPQLLLGLLFTAILLSGSAFADLSMHIGLHTAAANSSRCQTGLPTCWPTWWPAR